MTVNVYRALNTRTILIILNRVTHLILPRILSVVLNPWYRSVAC